MTRASKVAAVTKKVPRSGELTALNQNIHGKKKKRMNVFTKNDRVHKMVVVIKNARGHQVYPRLPKVTLGNRNGRGHQSSAKFQILPNAWIIVSRTPRTIYLFH